MAEKYNRSGEQQLTRKENPSCNAASIGEEGGKISNPYLRCLERHKDAGTDLYIIIIILRQ